MKEKFLKFLHSKLDSLLHEDCLNISDIQNKARILAQFRYQDSNYNGRSYLFEDASPICSFNEELKVKELCS